MTFDVPEAGLGTLEPGATTVGHAQDTHGDHGGGLVSEMERLSHFHDSKYKTESVGVHRQTTAHTLYKG